MVMPRRFSSSRRSQSMPVSARTRLVLPWSICPAVPMMTAMRFSLLMFRHSPQAGFCQAIGRGRNFREALRAAGSKTGSGFSRKSVRKDILPRKAADTAGHPVWNARPASPHAAFSQCLEHITLKTTAVSGKAERTSALFTTAGPVTSGERCPARCRRFCDPRLPCPSGA